MRALKLVVEKEYGSKSEYDPEEAGRESHDSDGGRKVIIKEEPYSKDGYEVEQEMEDESIEASPPPKSSP